ncbi:MAG TPA: aminopeptidase P N-terminal domain-containing protein [Rhodothermales bacterium]|nr:aminopeptidase P N-terminal domain-containing protein [Rhodothermales bacterium]
MHRYFSLLLIALAFEASSAQDGVPLFTENFPPEEFAARRAAVVEEIGSQAIALLQGAPAPVGYVRFRQSNEFFYLTGIEVPHAYLLIDGRTGMSSLYLPHRNQSRVSEEGLLQRYPAEHLLLSLNQ